MEYVYATLTLNETGAEINEHNLTAVLEAADAVVAESRVKAIVAALEDVDLDAVAGSAAEAVTEAGSRENSGVEEEPSAAEPTGIEAGDETDDGPDGQPFEDLEYPPGDSEADEAETAAVENEAEDQ